MAPPDYGCRHPQALIVFLCSSRFARRGRRTQGTILRLVRLRYQSIADFGVGQTDVYPATHRSRLSCRNRRACRDGKVSGRRSPLLQGRYSGNVQVSGEFARVLQRYWP